MNLFHKIEGAVAIVRRGPVYEQSDVYARGGQFFISHSGGFIRVGAPFGDSYGTGHPDIKVLEIEGIDIALPKGTAPTYTGTGA